jgi:hypothetical protein
MERSSEFIRVSNSRVVPQWPQFLDERAQHRRDKGRADAVAHYVADENSRGRFGNALNVKKISAYRACRLIAMAETQPPFTVVPDGGNAGVLLRQECLLNLARHLQVFLHLRVLLADFPLLLFQPIDVVEQQPVLETDECARENQPLKFSFLAKKDNIVEEIFVRPGENDFQNFRNRQTDRD